MRSAKRPRSPFPRIVPQPILSKRSVETSPQGPTLRRLVQSRGRYDVGDERGKPQLTMRDAPIERLHADKRISEAQYQAAEKFRTHWFHAGMGGRYGNMFSGVVSWGGSSAHGPEDDCHHSNQVRAAWVALGRINARKLVHMVVWLDVPLEEAGRGMGWKTANQARAAALTLLRAALDELADLWGLGVKRKA